jgi:outer membrane protein
MKIGYANMEQLLSSLPEMKKVESEFASFDKQLKTHLETQFNDFQKKVEAFRQHYESMPEAERTRKQTELEQLQGTLQKLQQESQEQLANKHNNLLEPLLNQVKKAIQQVAKEQGYAFILNENAGGMPTLLFVDEHHNVSSLVLKKLGVAPAIAPKKK